MSDSMVLEAAHCYLTGLRGDPDPMLAPWRGATLGEPEMVRTVELQPSFWLVPVTDGGRTLGHIEVGLEGRILGHSYLYRHPDDLSAVERPAPEEARQQAEAVLVGYPGAEVTGPVWVHDGARSRMAWMFEVRREGRLLSRVFVTPGYVYERQAGEPGGHPGLRGVG